MILKPREITKLFRAVSPPTFHIGTWRHDENPPATPQKVSLLVKKGKKKKLVPGKLITLVIHHSRNSLVDYLYEIGFQPANENGLKIMDKVTQVKVMPS